MTYTLMDKQRKSLTVLNELGGGENTMQEFYFMLFPRFPFVSEH